MIRQLLEFVKITDIVSRIPRNWGTEGERETGPNVPFYCHVFTVDEFPWHFYIPRNLCRFTNKAGQRWEIEVLLPLSEEASDRADLTFAVHFLWRLQAVAGCSHCPGLVSLTLESRNVEGSKGTVQSAVCSVLHNWSLRQENYLNANRHFRPLHWRLRGRCPISLNLWSGKWNHWFLFWSSELWGVFTE